jgi:nucleoside diphosphate kinase
MAKTYAEIMKMGKDEGKELDEVSVCFTLGYLAGAAAKAKAAASMNNVALVFVKPHANSPKVQGLIESKLIEMGFKILAKQVITAAAIEKGSLAAKHYYAIASKAGYVPSFKSPAMLNVPKDKFEDKFKVNYDEMVKAGKVMSGKDACTYLGVTKAELDTINFKEKKAGNLIKFGGGFYCGRLPGKAADEFIYVFNAFCGSMLDAYVAADSQGVTCFKIQWDESTLSWEDFRGKKLGPTDPSKAPADSLRGLVFAKWKELGLSAEPNVGLNGVHGSASPFEAMAECENWFGEKLTDSPFYKALLSSGVSDKQINEWKFEAQIVLESGKKGSSFDVVEDTNATDCVATMAKLAKLN